MTTPSEDRDTRRPGLQREARHKREALWESASVGAVGIEMALAILIGALIGRWIDDRFATEPAFTLIFLGVGIAAAFKGLIRVARQHHRKLSREREENPGDSEREPSEAPIPHENG